MKLIIDIDEQHFELLQMAVMNGMGDKAQKIIAQGTPIPDNATNGEVIKAMFPNLKITKMNDYVSVMGEYYEFNNFYPFDFWNALYKKGGKE